MIDPVELRRLLADNERLRQITATVKRAVEGLKDQPKKHEELGK